MLLLQRLYLAPFAEHFSGKWNRRCTKLVISSAMKIDFLLLQIFRLCMDNNHPLFTLPYYPNEQPLTLFNSALVPSLLSTLNPT